MSTQSNLGSTELENAVGPCQRKFGLKHIIQLMPMHERRGRKLGSILHVLFRYWYAQFLVGGPPAWFNEMTCEDAVNKEGQGHPDLIQQAVAIYHRYVDQFGAIDRSWRVILIERQLSMSVSEIVHWASSTLSERTKSILHKLPPQQRITIRPDLIVARPDGVQFIIDFKSTLGQWSKLPRWSRFNSYGLAWQPMMYLWVARRALNEYGNLAHPNIKSFIIQRVLTIDDFKSDRHEIEMTSAAYEYMPNQILQRLAARNELVERAQRGEDLDPAYGSECFGRYGSCDYLNICRAEDDEKPGIIQTQYRRVLPSDTDIDLDR